ncbi:MAG TPA: glycosyltransferase family 39 protein, partial [Terrimicrobiaceae bacterium]|nr:glycosyltransferase family 39 protein [Terrimicrobiaceae bacterium]
MARPSKPSAWLAALLVLAAALLVATAGWGDLYNETDGQYAGAAKVMAAGGSWLIPENNGVPRLVKPPLLYWAMAVAMEGFGVNAFAARLPSALALGAWVAVTFLIGNQMGGPWRGFVSGLIMLTSLGTFTLGRVVMPEPLFAMCIAAAIFCALRGQHAPAGRAGWFTGFWLCAGLASFSKGWHGLLYPLAVIGLAALLCRGARPGLRGLISWHGPLLAAAINLPWYIYVERQFPGYLQNLFFAEQLGHVTGSDAPATSYTDVPRLQFLLLHLAWFFPWSLAAACAFWQRRREAVAAVMAMSWPAAVCLSWTAIIGGSALLSVLLPAPASLR